MWGIKQKSDGFASTVVKFDAVDHIFAFLLIGVIMFVPWMFVWGGYVDSTMTNEEKFNGLEDCDMQEEELPVGRAVSAETDGNLCSPSNRVVLGYFISGILTYALCYRGAVAILKVLFLNHKV
jgi:hypothetical protein